jgi:hypothetical protein
MLNTLVRDCYGVKNNLSINELKRHKFTPRINLLNFFAKPCRRFYSMSTFLQYQSVKFIIMHTRSCNYKQLTALHARSLQFLTESMCLLTDSSSSFEAALEPTRRGNMRQQNASSSFYKVGNICQITRS